MLQTHALPHNFDTVAPVQAFIVMVFSTGVDWSRMT